MKERVNIPPLVPAYLHEPPRVFFIRPVLVFVTIVCLLMNEDSQSEVFVTL